MRTEYDGLHSRIETSETRINKELRDKTEEQARQDATMVAHRTVVALHFNGIHDKLKLFCTIAS
jgi:hypothetical protein